MKGVLIYCYDAWCGWCFGFSPVIRKLNIEFRNMLTIEVLSGGMILPQQPAHVSIMANYVLENYEHVEARTGVHFGEDYLWHMQHPELSDWFPSSEKPAIALSVFKEYQPEHQVNFIADLQHALFVEGRDLTDDEAYRHLIHKYALDENIFYQNLHSETYKEKAYEDFALCQRLQAKGFPQLMLQVSEKKIYLICRGYEDYPSVSHKINQILLTQYNIN
ncbi:MAG: DsbA family protein [Bacteroidota bacterium]|jgi:putative protein-disulfide isomerase